MVLLGALIDSLHLINHFYDIQLATAREKRLKEWKRQWKIDLIQKMNPDWQDLYHNIIQ
jgi:putative endonuclease